MKDVEKSLGMPTGFEYGLIALVLLVGIVVFAYFVFAPLVKSILPYL